MGNLNPPEEGTSNSSGEVSKLQVTTNSDPVQKQPSDVTITNTQAHTDNTEPNAAKSVENIHTQNSLFLIDKAVPIDPREFPNPPRGGSDQVKATIPNVQHLLNHYGIIVRYDVIHKRLITHIPGLTSTPDNQTNVAIAQIVSLARLNGMPVSNVPEFIAAIADRHPINCVADWITCKPWDGIDRLQALFDTLVTPDDFPWPLKQVLMHKWLIGAVAAVMKPSGFKARGVLTLQGQQSIGKTAWVSSLVPDEALRESCVKLDHHLDAGNKDSQITAISHWIVEIGELDSSFRKDVARLKGFLTADRDKVRRPYGRTDSEYPRKTVFCATVNDPQFLVDSTGNTRWWTIPVIAINFKHGIDMQQLFAQVAENFSKGEQWWLTQAEEQLLEGYNKNHRSISVILEQILDIVDLDRATEDGLPTRTAIAMLKEIGIERPTNPQCKEAASVLRELFGMPKRIQGSNKWRVPIKGVNAKKPTWPILGTNTDDDEF